MKVVVLDGHTLNPDDLSWDPLGKFGDLTVYPRTSADQIINRANGAEIVLLNKIKLTKEIIDQLLLLKYIGLLATGHDNVDLETAKQRGIVVSNVPAYGTPSVAQHTFALILELTNRVGIHNKSVHELEWVRSEDFSYFKSPLTELAGKTLGLIGLGAISKAVAKIGTAFGMNVIIYSRHATSTNEGKLVDLPQLIRVSDFISIHTSLSADNFGLVNAAFLNSMKRSACLINTSRGAIINENALSSALNEGRIAGAALDVLAKEPPLQENPLLTATNCIITPHISWVSHEARQRLMDIAVENVKAFLDGSPINQVG